jgi:hypothetical protein
MNTRTLIRNLFARTPRTIRKEPVRFRPRVEALEDRSVPSVTVVGDGAGLNITDNDTTGHSIVVEQTASQGTFTVQIDGGALMTFTGVKQINANLGADSDLLGFYSEHYTTNLAGNLSVTARDGNNLIQVGFNAIKGNVSISEGNGVDETDLLANAINGNVSVTQGDGGGVVGDPSADGGGPSGGGGGGPSGGGGYGYGGGDVVTVRGVTIGGNLAVTQGNGASDAVFVQGGVGVGGNSSITQGNGDSDAVFVESGVSVGGNLSITQGDGLADVLESHHSRVRDLSVGGNLSVFQGNGQSDSASIGDYSVGGNLAVTQGNGAKDGINIEDMTVAGNTSLQLGNGVSDFVNVGTDSTGNSVTFGKNVSINFGNGGGASLSIGGTDDRSDSVSFDGQANFSAGGSGNIYSVGDKVSFQDGQPNRNNI